MRSMINTIAMQRGEYGGYPLPDDEIPITLEPSHPLTKLQGMAINKTEPSQQALDRAAELFGFDENNERVVIVNNWMCSRTGKEVFLYHFVGQPNKVKAAVLPRSTATRRLEMLLKTMGTSLNWSVSAEETALEKLRTIVTPAAYRYYVLTGMFIETSKRSGVTYLFHRLRPTLAFRHQPDGTIKVLAALCGHPIGYYDGSFSGAMVPTDDVIAHVILMRGDEHLFWRKCNQHAEGIFLL